MPVHPNHRCTHLKGSREYIVSNWTTEYKDNDGYIRLAEVHPARRQGSCVGLKLSPTVVRRFKNTPLDKVRRTCSKTLKVTNMLQQATHDLSAIKYTCTALLSYLMSLVYSANFSWQHS
jgi:hypothetical protein